MPWKHFRIFILICYFYLHRLYNEMQFFLLSYKIATDDRFSRRSDML